MAFKKFSEYVEEKQGRFFVLRNDGDSADVIFLYRNSDDVMVADTHWISSPSYNGYVLCPGTPTCPACNWGKDQGKNGIRKQTSLFIPMFNLNKNVIEFWDRSSNFEHVLQESVFKNYPNPSEFIFTITRRGAAGDRNTRYEIVAKYRNSSYPYEKILADNGVSFPEEYYSICKEVTDQELHDMLYSTPAPTDLSEFSYVPVPRGGATAAPVSSVPDLPEINIDTPVYSAPPTDLPPAPDDFVASTGSNDSLPAPDFNEPVSAEGLAANNDQTDDSSDLIDF